MYCGQCRTTAKTIYFFTSSIIGQEVKIFHQLTSKSHSLIYHLQYFSVLLQYVDKKRNTQEHKIQ